MIDDMNPSRLTEMTRTYFDRVNRDRVSEGLPEIKEEDLNVKLVDHPDPTYSPNRS